MVHRLETYVKIFFVRRYFHRLFMISIINPNFLFQIKPNMISGVKIVAPPSSGSSGQNLDKESYSSAVAPGSSAAAAASPEEKAADCSADLRQTAINQKHIQDILANRGLQGYF